MDNHEHQSINFKPVKPFLRWAGGKTWILKHLNQIIGDTIFNNYHEPFLGSAAIFLALQPKGNVFLSDLNKELIDTYLTLKEQPKLVIDKLKTFQNTEEYYYKIRGTTFTSSVSRAAQFIYLNQTSYNGLYRVNLQGVYNVPYGYRKKNFLEEDKLIAVSLCLQRTVITCGDFDNIRPNVHKGDLVFLDPPYTVSHNDNGFIKYNQKIFSLQDQYRLSSLIDYIKEKGAYYILTNAAHNTILDIFNKNDRLIELYRANLIGGKNAKRGQISEYIFTNISGDNI